MTLLWDHLLVALLVLVVPFYGRATYRTLAARIAAGVPDVRLSEYRWTISLQWGLTAAVLLLWWADARPLAALGLTVQPGPGTAVGVLLTLLGLGFLGLQWRGILRLDENGAEALRAQLAGAQAMLPSTDRETRWFRVLAITAGFCEEVVFRGFLIWYFAAWTGPWAAAVAGAVVFGHGHFYQGTSGILKTGVAGLIAGLLFVGTGSLLWPMLLHAAVDLQGGAVGRKLLKG